MGGNGRIIDVSEKKKKELKTEKFWKFFFIILFLPLLFPCCFSVLIFNCQAHILVQKNRGFFPVLLKLSSPERRGGKATPIGTVPVHSESRVETKVGWVFNCIFPVSTPVTALPLRRRLFVPGKSYIPHAACL